MARTPIINVEVNDESFQRFKSLYDEYQKTLGEQGEKWAQANESVDAMAAAFIAVTAALETHNALLERQRKHAEELAKAERERQKAEEAIADKEKEAERRRRKAVEDTKKIAMNVRDTAIDLAKWVAFGGLAGLAADALGVWGLRELVQGPANQLRAAQGVGVSVAERQALNLNMQRYFDVNSVLENIAQAQADPSRRWAFTGVGVNPMGKDPAQLAQEIAVAARRSFIQGGQNQLWAQAHGLLEFFTMDELRRMARTPEDQLRGSVGQTAKDMAPGGRAFLADQVAKKWQDFIVVLDRAGLGLQNKLVDKLSALEAPLSKFIDRLGDMAVQWLDKIDFNALGDGLQKFTDYISSAKFQQDFTSFIDNVSAVTAKLADLLRILGLVPAAPTTPPPAGLPSTTTPYDPKASGALLGGGIVGGILGATGAGNVGSRLHGIAAEKWAGQNLMGWGWTPAQTAGIIENIRSEDASWNPFAQGDFVKGHATAFGIGQWHSDRQAQYAKLFGHSMQSVTDPAQALREQLEFVQWELTHTFKKAGDDLRRSRSAFESGFTISKEYERPAGGTGEALARGAGAQALVSIEVKNQTGASIAAAANAASR